MLFEEKILATLVLVLDVMYTIYQVYVLYVQLHHLFMDLNPWILESTISPVTESTNDI